MSKYEVEAIYHLPDTHEFGSTQELIKAVVEPSDEDGEWWGGFKGEQYLADELENRYGEINPKSYQPLSESQFEEVKSTVKTTTDKVVGALPPPNFDITIHLYPWFEPEGEVVFGGVNGKTFFGNGFHIYLDTKKFTHQSLRETLAHEYNHAVRNQHIDTTKRTIGDAIVMEGLAEHFREGVIGGDTAAWSEALDHQEASKYLKEIKDELQEGMKNQALYDEVFYGKRDYPRWTGYSIGYHLVGKFIKENAEKNWPSLMGTKTETFIAVDL